MTVTAPSPGPESADPLEGGVIEDARRRQRRHRLGGSALIAGALVAAGGLIGVAGGGGGSAARPGAGGRQARPAAGLREHAQTAITRPAGVDQLGLLAPGVGWVDSGQATYLTRNGGRSWSRVKAIGAGAELAGASTSGPGQVIFALADGAQSQHSCGQNCASETTAAPGSSTSQRGQVVLTNDAGRSWSSDPFPSRAVPGAVSFPNTQDGFAIAYRPTAHRDPRPSLYATRDGARTWSRVSVPPFQGSLSFANARDGLGGGFTLGGGLVDSGAIYRTSDGGRSWVRTSLCRPASVYACEAPYLFASGRGVVAVVAHYGQAGAGSVEVYTTRNYGVSWHRHLLPHTPALSNQPAYIPFAAPNPEDLFAWVSPYLYTSTDGGRTWSRHAATSLVVPGVPGSLAFANASYGWYGIGPVFDYTTDGGRHWASMNDR